MKEIDSATFAGMVRQGAAALGREKSNVNDLNVFPVPDGDTGDNMYMTIKTGCTALDGSTATLSETASAVSSKMLLGARGNSGVILSRMFAGLAKGFTNLETASVEDFTRAMKKAVEEAYSSVSNPVEGTILTVLREGVENADSGSGLDVYFDTLLEAMRESLEHTPEKLDVLREAGVVDSGGAGLVCIVEGMRDMLEGKRFAEPEAPQADVPNATLDLSAFGEDSVMEFGYCTEFLLRLTRNKVDPDAFDERELFSWLEANGESVVAFREGTIIKAHIHTFAPGEILNHVQRYGEFLTIKIENMALQHHQTVEDKAPEPEFRLPRKKYAIVTVASGEGLAGSLREIGADVVIPGGQTMNPSTQDFLDAFDKVDAGTILVFPNNSNVIMAAEQAASMYAKAEVKVLHSKDFGQGYYGIASVDSSCGDSAQVVSDVAQAMENLVTGEVSRAVRDALSGNVRVHADEYVGYSGKEILCCSPSREEAAVRLCEKLGADRRDVMLLFRGCDVPEEEAAALVGKLSASYRNLEIITNDGGQPVYDYICVLC